jgi:flagellar biosynthesis chaperone FliJ
MNNDRRKALAALRDQVENLKSELEQIASEEQEYYDNMPENMQGGEKGDKAQAAIDALQEADSAFDDILNNIDTAGE